MSDTRTTKDARASSEGEFEKRYAALNEEQRRAVDAVEGPVLVLAGPGSGKTEILSLRVANILRVTDASPSNILCLTFTDAAAANMRARLANLIGSAAYRVTVSTFHGFCQDVIGRYPEHFLGGANVSPADDVVRHQTMTAVFEALPYDHPLRSYHPEQGFVNLRPVMGAIGRIKQGGLSPDEFEAVLEHNARWYERLDPLVHEAFGDRISKKTIERARVALNKARALESVLVEDPFPATQHRSVLEAFVMELADAVERAEAESITEPLKRFKERFCKRTEEGTQALADSVRHERLHGVAGVYRTYHAELRKQGYYDFDDILLDAVSAIERLPSIRFDLQERYQYVLVDEFQDTNDAQLRLVRAIADAPVNEGRPNVMAVGDDDQAIYRFQGANASNVLDFARMFRDPVVITMVSNYRSSQRILDIARAVIVRGEDRLERTLEGVSKELRARGALADHAASDALTYHSYETDAHERAAVARRIAKMIESGTDPDSIAVIARKHKHLEELVPYFSRAGVPVRYERRQDVLEDERVAQLILALRFIATRDDALLADVMCFPFWGLERLAVWRVSVRASRERIPWLEAMRVDEDERMQSVAAFLIELSQRAAHEPAERILDAVIGCPPMGASEDDANGETVNLEQPAGFISPFCEYYFGPIARRREGGEYLAFLSAIRAFLRAVREHRQGVTLRLSDVVAFVDAHRTAGIPLLDDSPFSAAPNAVTLLTAHKAKGLEYDVVFVVSCVDDQWTGRGRGTKITFPMNLPLSPESDTLDDQLRLLYVALTRARRELHLTAHRYDESGEDVAPLRFLVPEEGDASAPLRSILEASSAEEDPTLALDAIATTLPSGHGAPYARAERSLLESIVADYQMSVTHLNAFLNLERGGPQAFIEQNLLRFPQAKSAAAAYGTAVHAAIERAFMRWRRDGELPPLTVILEAFDERLRYERLPESDEVAFRDKGRAALEAYYDALSGTWTPTDVIEANFANQGVMAGTARLTGKIDRMIRREGGELEVRDMKTGKPFSGWDDTYRGHEAVKVLSYRRQLVFYKLLVEGSREYHGNIVRRGALEFVEPSDDGIVVLPLDISEAEAQRTADLAEAVYKRIVTLDFPDTQKYPMDASGIQAFEDDLLSGAI